MNSSVEGLDQAIKELNNKLSQITNLSEKELNDITQDLKGKSQRICPLELGDLAGSASADVKKEGENITGEVGFNEPYALEQHENLHYNHPGGKQAKYLEQSLVENTPNYFNMLKNAVEKGTE